MSIEGTLDDFRVPDILQMVAQQGKTGILTVQGKSTIIAVSFLSGGVVAADSLQETVEERLGEVLVREGLLSRTEFAEVVAEQRAGHGRLIDLLVEGGYLGRDDILESLRVQTRELLERLVEWRSGEFKFYANDEVAYEEGFQPIVVGDLLISLLPKEPTAAVAEQGDSRGETWDEEVGDDTLGDSFADTSFGPPASGEGGDPVLHYPALAAGTEPSAEPQPYEDRSFTEEMARVVPLPVTRVRPLATDDWAEDGIRPAAPVETATPRRGERSVPSETEPVLQRWFPPLLALVLALAVVASLALMPARALLPLPWQAGERDDFQSAQRLATYSVIDGAAKTFFLVEGRFPESLERLVAASVLHPHDLTDPSGHRLEMAAGEESYELRSVPDPGEAPDPAATTTEAITGNFLLDPEYLSAGPMDTVAPLVLLD